MPWITNNGLPCSVRVLEMLEVLQEERKTLVTLPVSLLAFLTAFQSRLLSDPPAPCYFLR